MKIIYAKGQTCNQFWQYSTFIADCIENKGKFGIWIPDITLRYFPNLYNSTYIYFPLYSKTIVKIIGYKFYISSIILIFSNRFSIRFFKSLLNKLPNVSFCTTDVGFKRSPFLIKHLDQIRLIFTPEEPIVNAVNEIFDKIRIQFTLIIGVHIRYGDYRTFNNGQYFYTIPQYLAIMQSIKLLFPKKKIAFFIACNESIDLLSFTSINCFTIPESTSVKDLYGLSRCDYIIGPPSTFSGWASLIGNVPLYFIENSSEKVNLRSFKQILDIWS